MRQHLATFDLCQPFFNLFDKPLVIVDKTLDRFLRQHFEIAATLGGELGKLGLQIGIEVNVHGASVGGENRSVKPFTECSVSRPPDPSSTKSKFTITITFCGHRQKIPFLYSSLGPFLTTFQPCWGIRHRHMNVAGVLWSAIIVFASFCACWISLGDTGYRSRPR